ncbi:hypothetical protein K1T71_010757 [Dendrolimus kikuchii]|uniref:Uncharacterized protein n=1 Tax=Dendrolimus kikuchii TaxID=765133 RepID=A0ACC1CQ02_9NEOP|nr:hypothetical protein K1T71_010757 [Dendrolimus kikuchii]
MFKKLQEFQFLSRYKLFNFSLRLRHKTTTDCVEKDKSTKVASDVVKFLQNSDEYRDVTDKLPKSLLRKYRSPESMYLINRKTAKDIVNTVKEHLNDSPIIEVNPGLGLITERLLHCQKNHIYLYESLSYFSQHLHALQRQYPNQITLKIADFFKMWKLAFQDKMDNGSRVRELLGNLYTHDNEGVVKIIGSMPGLSFIKHLIFNIVFHNTTNQFGRPDLFITLPVHQYEFLTDSEVQLSKHISVPSLFQLLFNYKVLKSVPKVHFLPWIHQPPSSKGRMMDEYNLYLVNITQKEQLPCPSKYLPLLWYFFKPHVFSKSTRVIPMLEQWIPGCGVWLITGQDPPDTNRQLSPGKDDAELPHMTIFTEFRDLTLYQKLTVFKRFISWPEFEQCQFRVTMENNLPRYVTELEKDDKDTTITHIDEDIEHSDIENDEFDK